MGQTRRGRVWQKSKKDRNRLTVLYLCVYGVCACMCTSTGGWELLPQANNMEFEILAGVVIEHGSLITGLPGWPVITMTYHWAVEHGVYNKIL